MSDAEWHAQLRRYCAIVRYVEVWRGLDLDDAQQVLLPTEPGSPRANLTSAS